MNENWDEFIKTHTEEEVAAELAKIKCSICGEPFTIFDLYLGDNRYDIFVNYPSDHDLQRVQFNFCVDCFDKVLDTIIPMCKINPIVDDDWWDHCLNEKGHIDEKKGPGGESYMIQRGPESKEDKTD